MAKISDIRTKKGPQKKSSVFGENAPKKKLWEEAGVKKHAKRAPKPTPQKSRSARGTEHNSAPPKKAHTKVGSGQRSGRLFLWVIAFAFVVLAVLAVLSLFGGATVTVTPKQEKSFIDGTFSAFAAEAEETAPEGELLYQLITLSESAEAEISARDTEYVEEKAQGEIVIYNAFSTGPQRLVRNTRFEAPDGKIYRIKESIDVPGKTQVDGETVPGSILATVYADEPGEAYNKELVDFTIPGFEGSPQFEHFYARSKTHMTGGFIGDRPIPAEKDVEKARTKLTEELRSTLVAKARAQTPDTFALHDGSIFIDFSETHIGENPEGSGALVSVTGTLHGVIFSKSELASFIAERATARYDGHPVRVIDIESLPLTTVYEPEEGAGSVSDVKKISFTLTSDVHVVWNVALDDLRTALVGKEKDQFNQILAEFPGIESAQASVRPFWKGSFPQNPEEIVLKERVE